MRNKTDFIEDVKEVIKPDVLTDEQLIEDAAHTMNNLETESYTLPKSFTTTGKDETFIFKKLERPSTDGGDSVDDYFYKKRGE